MKKILFFLFMFILCIQSYAQIPVTDVAANTTQVTNQIVNAGTWGQQLFELQQQASILTTTLKYVQEVSSVVRDAAYAKYLIERQFRIVEESTRLMKRADVLDPYFILAVERNLMNLLATNTSLVALITSTLTTRFKMGDSERLATLMRIKDEQMLIMRELSTLDLIIGTSLTTKTIIEYQLFK
jgi:hypothetical protein